MSGNAPRAEEAARWFALARDDQAASIACLAARLPGIAAYHAQQSAEKANKGLLVLAGAAFRRIHDLDELAETAVPAYPDLSDCLDRLRPLTSWGGAITVTPGPMTSPRPRTAKFGRSWSISTSFCLGAPLGKIENPADRATTRSRWIDAWRRS
ncbi:MAG: HEPN domain-containing protein [Alphaproteobacteria bacterium]|nr:HEPN domain-containing protein [Alphaproteobacteria bacterium]